MESYLRIIDAAANRAGEGLRVIEDFVRFIQNDADTMAELKNLRHRLTSNMKTFSMAQRLECRDTDADVGTQISTDTEFRRADLEDVLNANFSRLQESLRSLEEFSKLVNPAAAHEFEQIRYRTYILQKKLGASIFKNRSKNGETDA